MPLYQTGATNKGPEDNHMQNICIENWKVMLVMEYEKHDCTAFYPDMAIPASSKFIIIIIIIIISSSIYVDVVVP